MSIFKKNFCIVGCGEHAKLKIIPALLKLKNVKLSIVSKKKMKLNNYKIYSSLIEALKTLSEDTIFVLTSPPELHYQQISLILSFNRDVYVEKPIFVSLTEAKSTFRKLEGKNNILVEMLMYKYTKLYKIFKKHFTNNINQIKKIEIIFTLPNLPSNTFRDNLSVKSSIFYDMGCYIFSLLNDLSIPLKNFKVKEYEINNRKIQNIIFFGSANNMDIYAELGINNIYMNKVTLTKHNSAELSFENFFYGRETSKRINISKKNKFRELTFKDINGFYELFKIPRNNWIETQKKRMKKILKINKKMETIESKLK